ncbi:MAG: helix-turn-helix domain-containing protein [Oscillospiraceae bacterium]|nr:helix-turn-helix domain-containing protein [Oscillospiraceae bacterium]
MENKIITLKETERKKLEEFAKNGVHNAHLITRAKVILKLDRSNKKEHLRITRISKEVNLSRQAIYDIRDAFIAAANIETFLKRKKREKPPVPAKVTGEVEAHIIAIACSEAPEGRARWTMQLIADRCVEMKCIDSISEKSVRRVLKKRNIDPT